MPLYQTNVSIQKVDAPDDIKDTTLRTEIQSEIIGILKAFYDYDPDNKVFYINDKEMFNRQLQNLRRMMKYDFKYSIVHEKIPEDDKPENLR